MDDTVTKCSVCGKLLQFKWMKTDILVEDENRGGYNPGSYGVCRPCFLKAMGVKPNATTDVEKVLEMPVSRKKPVRTRRTAVTKSDIDRYRRSTRTNGGGKKAPTGRESWHPLPPGPGSRGWKPDPLRNTERRELPSAGKQQTDGSSDKEV